MLDRTSYNNTVMTSGRQVGYDQIALGVGVALVAAGVAVLLPRAARHRTQLIASKAPRQALAVRPAEPPRETSGTTIRAGQRLNCAAGTLAFSVLADSAIEHYRGSFNNPAMYTPLVVSLSALGVSLHGVADERSAAVRIRHATYLTSALTGLLGTGFHIYNIIKRPGRVDWQNVFYGAPVGAPMALALSGLLGVFAERVRNSKPGKTPQVAGIQAGPGLAAIASVGLLGTSGEAALLHFRGAFHDPFMLLPVTLPPVGAALLARAALRGRGRAFTRWWLRMTAAVGLAGMGFHAYGVQRNMDGWRNWSQNVLNGPPLPAPPSFTGLALAGLAALALLEERQDA
jgi:hypothetical protein